MKVEEKKMILDDLIAQGLLDYGSVINRDEFIQLFGIKELPDEAVKNMTVKQIKSKLQDNELAELVASDFIRNELIKAGKFFTRAGDTYRVLLPSENASMADRYMKSATRKIRRARNLIKNSPVDVLEKNASVASRLLLAERQSKRLRH